MRSPILIYISITTCLSLLIAFNSYAQYTPQRWGGGVDDEAIHFGFSFHYINADYKFELEDDWSSDGYTSAHSPFSHNVGLGLLADLKINENLNLRFSPNLSFLNIDVNFDGAAATAQNKNNPIHRTNIGIPLLLKFKSDRKTNMRGYLIGGGELAVNVSPTKRYKVLEDIITKSSYFAYTAGIGFDIYFDFFKMSPELRWTQSIGNLLSKRSENVFTNNLPLQRLYLRSFQVSLYFE